MTRIYCGNLPFNATEDQVRGLFEEFGTVQEVSLVTDRETGRPRGFGFVEMDEDGAGAAIQALDGSMFGGRNLRVNEARPREETRQSDRRSGGYSSRQGGGSRRDSRGGGRRYQDDW